MARIGGQQPFTALPNWIFEKQKREPGWLSCQELSVLLVLQHFANGAGHGDEVFPSLKTISVCAGISKSTVGRTVLSLTEKRLIEKTPRYDELGQRTNLYRLMVWDGLPTGSELPAAPPPLSERPAPLSERPAPLVTLTSPPSQRDHRTITMEQEPSTKKKTPHCPPGGQAKAGPPLPSWAEPFRPALAKWLENRKAKHKLEPEITIRSLNALEYAKEYGVLKDFCEYASERNWISLGYAGHKDLVQRLQKEAGKAQAPNQQKIAPINYTL